MIPVAGRLSGAAGTTWRTDLTISNPSRNFGLTGDIIFHADGGGEQRQTFTLAPMASAQYRDLIATLGYDVARGVLRIVSTERPVVARARIYNVGHPAGEFGQDVPAIPIESLSQRSVVAALSSADGNRTNLGVSNPHGTTASISVSWYDGDGESHGQVMTIDIPARGVLQINDIFDWTGQPRDVPLTIVVKSTSAAKPVCLWSSIVRNDTGDAVFVSGQQVLD